MVQYSFTSTEARRLVKTDSTAWDGHLDSHTAPELYDDDDNDDNDDDDDDDDRFYISSAVLRSRADSLRSHVIRHE